MVVLTHWQNFYVIIGSAAAALTGLMFIVVTLMAGIQSRRTNTDMGIAAFGTPNIVHFCAALLIAAAFCAPWQALWHVSVLLGLCGLGGMLYVVVVVRRARRQKMYTLVLEDWIWHVIVPLISYTILVVAAMLLPSYPILAPFGVGTATMLFLFIGIHNAWDTLTYMTIESIEKENGQQ